MSYIKNKNKIESDDDSVNIFRRHPVILKQRTLDPQERPHVWKSSSRRSFLGTDMNRHEPKYLIQTWHLEHAVILPEIGIDFTIKNDSRLSPLSACQRHRHVLNYIAHWRGTWRHVKSSAAAPPLALGTFSAEYLGSDDQGTWILQHAWHQSNLFNSRLSVAGVQHTIV
jgi:hypothetical protein